jgi:alkylation response protein AidB-like acyl-CoA dehydrogenase
VTKDTLLDRAALVAATVAIAPAVEAAGPASEAARRVAPEAVEAMTDAGIWRILRPERYGGFEAGLRAQLDTSTVMARAYPAAGWVQLVLGAHIWVLGAFPSDCQDEVFGEDPDVRIPGALAAQGRATAVAGGWRLDGRWQFCSGVDLGDWLLLGCIADRLPDVGDGVAAGAGGRGGLAHVVVPKAEVVVDDTWFTLGLRGTGSKDVVADGAFVPPHRIMATRTLFDGLSPHGATHASGLYRMPVLSSLSIQMGGPTVGMAERALDLHVERTRARTEVYTGKGKAQGAGAQARIALSEADVTCAALLARQAADTFDTIARSGSPATQEQRAEMKWHASYVVELCRRAADRVFAGAGAHAVYDDSLLQATYRDLTTASHHAAVDLDSTAEMYGRVALGLDPASPLL